MPLSRSLSRQYKRTLAHADKRSVNVHKYLLTKSTLETPRYVKPFPTAPIGILIKVLFNRLFTLDENECDVAFNVVILK